jgi:hypothetical protein
LHRAIKENLKQMEDLEQKKAHLLEEKSKFKVKSQNYMNQAFEQMKQHQINEEVVKLNVNIYSYTLIFIDQAN